MLQNLDRRRRGGFTLIELLVVIGIILVLMSILIPAAGMVKRRGYETRTRALMQKIAGGCQAYFNDFNAYPGLVAESDLNTVQPFGLTTTISSTENMVLSVCGGVALNGNVATYNASLLNTGPQSLNPTNPRQYQAYVSVNQGELSGGMFGDPNKQVNAIQDSIVPEYIDCFPDPKPIVYLRARNGARGIVNDASDPLSAEPQYDRFQIEMYANADTPAPPAIPWGSKGYYRSWADYLRNPGLTAVGPTGVIIANTPEVPRGRDSFMLISAGIDRKWFTIDDIFSSD